MEEAIKRIEESKLLLVKLHDEIAQLQRNIDLNTNLIEVTLNEIK